MTATANLLKTIDQDIIPTDRQKYDKYAYHQRKTRIKIYEETEANRLCSRQLHGSE